MGSSVRDLRRRIRSVKSTQQITRAMKLVASSKLRRAQEAMQRARPFAVATHELIANVRRRVPEGSHPLLVEREGKKTLLVLITADRGLAGAFNTNLIRAAMRWIRAHEGKREFALQLIGRKGRDFFRRRPYPIRAASVDLFRKLDLEVSKVLSDDLVKAFQEEGFDEVVLLFNRFRTVMTQDLTEIRLLPAGSQVLGEAEATGAGTELEYIYEPSPAELLDTLVPAAVHVVVHQALLESLAAETGARMVAMDNATKNAAELIAKLTLVMNRTRQAAITTEIIEIVSGASALETKD